MTTDTHPNLTETALGDIWRLRCEEEHIERSARDSRRHAEGEILRRAAEQDAQALGTPWGDIVITYPATYSYNSHIVDREFYALIERDGLIDQWNQFVQHSYKLNKTWLNKLVKRGAEYKDVIERMTNAATGSPKLDGPTLDQIDEAVARGDTVL